MRLSFVKILTVYVIPLYATGVNSVKKSGGHIAPMGIPLVVFATKIILTNRQALRVGVSTGKIIKDSKEW